MKLSSLTRTRKGRVALTAVPTLVVAGALMAGVANGAVPVSFAVSGTPFEIKATQLEGDGFSQYSGIAQEKSGAVHPVAISNIDHATLTDMCQSVSSDTPLGKLGLMITAGGDGKAAVAENLQIGMTQLDGDATFTDIHIGVDASTVRYGKAGTAGDFAQDAKHVSINKLSQKAWSTQAGTFQLNGLHLRLTSGQTCPDPK
ncbi:DUF6230 family protein [Luteimicrobium subarcticum]|uniref:Cholesterol esterase n=1 Tax=Luteimicrobium subarcticum TaxID=620910 RepID=A0A2M8WSW5_9MICO|nr:DUF6230 family protein [Luteimicrobium subarcticum]PJI94042.1 hypothetical protein CLV34_1526 [Luteimicrobium subarcticum]